jgi:hypothetical protein
MASCGFLVPLKGTPVSIISDEQHHGPSSAATCANALAGIVGVRTAPFRAKSNEWISDTVTYLSNRQPLAPLLLGRIYPVPRGAVFAVLQPRGSLD